MNKEFLEVFVDDSDKFDVSNKKTVKCEFDLEIHHFYFFKF